MNGLGAVPLVGGAHSALQGGEIVAGGRCEVVYRADISSWVLIECTGGALQVASGTKSGQVITVAQAAGVVGHARNLKTSVAAASTTATLTADEIIVETALGEGGRPLLPGQLQQDDQPGDRRRWRYGHWRRTVERLCGAVRDL